MKKLAEKWIREKSFRYRIVPYRNLDELSLVSLSPSM